jgi:hypothetical protein
MLSAATPLPVDTPRADPVGGLWRWLGTHRGAVRIAGLLAFAGPLTFFTGAASVIDSAAAADLGRLALWWLLYGISLWCLLLLAGYGGERIGRQLRPTVRSGLWLLAAVLAAALTNLLTAGRAALLIELGLVHSARTMHLHGFTFTLIMALLYFVYLQRSREHERAAARLAAAQAAQRRARHRIVQDRLQEVQARIDPQLLFEMLDALRRLYAKDPPRAERFLDELITFLRAALPRLRQVSSTLLREIELARAFIGLRQLADAGGAPIAVEVSPDVMHAGFPPGILLPLLQETGWSPAAGCRLAAARSRDSCRLVLTVGAMPSETAVERVRALLADVHGTSARLEIARRPDQVDIIVQVPYELA